MGTKQWTMIGGALAIATIAGAPAVAQDWSDDFESYSNGQILYHVNGWGAWDDNMAVAGSATNAHAHSGRLSNLIENSDDSIYTYAGYTGGSGVISAWLYLPSDRFFADFYFLVQNEYQHGGPYEWCIDLEFDFDGSGGQGPGTVVDAFRTETNTVNIQFDTWVEIRCEVDIPSDSIIQYYGGTEVARGQLFVRGGAPEIKNLDLYTTGSTGYYDDTAVTGLQGSGGGYTLAIDMPNGCPGSITVSWNGAGTGQQGLVFGNNQGNYTLPPNVPCGGTTIGVTGSVMLVDPPGIFSTGGGSGSFNGQVRANAPCDHFLQLVHGGDCNISNVVQIR